MTIAFWATVALLLIGGMLFVLPPLLRPAATVRAGMSPMAAYRDQRAQVDAEFAQGTLTREQHAEAIAELQARVVEEVGDISADKPLKPTPRSNLLVVAVALLIPLGALGLYGLLGTPSAMLPPEQQQAAAEGGHAISDAQMEELLQRVVEKLKANPDDYQGWHILARSYAALGRIPQAVDAYEHAYKLKKEDANMLADYADVLALANGRSLEGKPEQLVKEALKIDPKHQKALALMGTAAYNKKDFAGAAGWWKKLLATVEPNSEQALAIQANIRQAEAGGAPVAPEMSAKADQAAAPSAPADKPVAASGASVEGNVVVADSIKGSIPAGATLFVYARPAEGSRMPLAILRAPASSFPYAFKLDDSMAMTPETRLSLQTEVQLVARISKTGNAMGSPGDLTGTLGPVKVGSRDVKLVIDQVAK